jgi:hypothetical protein
MSDQSAEHWLADAKSLFERYQVGWAWWAYGSSGSGNPVPDCIENPKTGVSIILLLAISNPPDNWFRMRPFNKWIF